jgi:acetylornithine deacetylase
MIGKATVHTRLHQWIQENKKEVIRLTQELVRIPSVTGNEYDIQRHIHKVLEGMDLNPEMFFPEVEKLRDNPDFFETTSFLKHGYQDRPNVGGIMKGSGGGRSLTLSGHVDVVSPEPLKRWTRNPWSGEILNEVIHGRGSGDMKAGVAAMIFAVRAVQETGIRLQGDVQIETTIEEEDGGVGGVLYMRTVRPSTDAALIPEPTDLNITVASAGVMYFRVIVPGVPAHAATAHIGVNAVLKAIPIMQAIDALHKSRQARISYSFVESDPSMRGKVTTINIGVIRAGDWPSTVPGSCVIECRIGWPPGESREDIIKQVEDTIKTAAQSDEWLRENPPVVEWFGWRARPHELSPKDEFIQTVRQEVIGVSGRVPTFTGGSAGLDTRYFVHHGIPAVTCGPKAERIHSFDEVVHVDSVVQVAQVIASTMIDWCGTIK